MITQQDVLLSYEYFKDNYQLTLVDLRKQKDLDSDLRAFKQIEFCGMLNTV